MSFFNSIKSASLTNSHGECNFFLITEGNADLTGFADVEVDKSGLIVGHSESGHNHVLERGDMIVKERVIDGMKVLHAILREPLTLRQSAGTPHKEQIVEPGEYFITNNVEYNPFLEQARRVAD